MEKLVLVRMLGVKGQLSRNIEMNVLVQYGDGGIIVANVGQFPRLRAGLFRKLAARAIAADKTDPFVLITVAACCLLVGNIDDAMRYSDIAITIIVGAGRSAPKPANTLLNSGMTNNIITEMTSADTIE